MEELFPLEDVELAEGEVVICWGDTSIELSPLEEVAEASEDSGLTRFSSGLVWPGRSRGGFLGAISAFRLHRDILNSWLNLTRGQSESTTNWQPIVAFRCKCISNDISGLLRLPSIMLNFGLQLCL